MTSAFVDQTRDNPTGGKPHIWSERKLIRVHNQSETNGELAQLPLVEQNNNTDHLVAPTAKAVIDKSVHTCWCVMNIRRWFMLRRQQNQTIDIMYLTSHLKWWQNGQEN